MQTFQEFEVILIDDGSNDSSGLICDNFAKKDDRFKVYHKENEGVSAARQFGLDRASGEYIIHVDPDDWVEASMLEELYNQARKENADLVICDYYNDCYNKSSYTKQKPDLSKKDGYFTGLINSLYGACWNKLVKKSCFTNYNISFVKGMVVWEDKLLNLKLAVEPIKISYLPKAFYHYVARYDSAVKKHSKDRVNSMILLAEWLESQEWTSKNEDMVELKKYIKRDAFTTRSIHKSEFNCIYPEVNNNFSFRISDIGRTTDFFIVIAFKFSFTISRFLFFLKRDCSKKVRSLWQR